MVERGGLENRCAPWGHRGFESLSLRKRQITQIAHVCAIWVICILLVLSLGKTNKVSNPNQDHVSNPKRSRSSNRALKRRAHEELKVPSNPSNLILSNSSSCCISEVSIIIYAGHEVLSHELSWTTWTGASGKLTQLQITKIARLIS